MDSSDHPEPDGVAEPDAEPRSEIDNLRRELAASKQAIERLRSENANMNAITESAAAAIVVRSIDGTILSWNRGAEVMYGYSASEVVGRPISNLVRQERQALWYDWFERVNRGEALDRVEALTLRKDGSPVNILVSIFPVRDAAGQVVRVVALLLDISKEKKAEEQLRESGRRLELLSRQVLRAQETERSRISRELHDEIGQVLTQVSMNLQALLVAPSTHALTSGLEQSIESVNAAIERVRTLSFELRPSTLDDLGLAAALRFYLDQTARTSGIQTYFLNELGVNRLPRDLETTIYRLVQEATTNALRHSRARNLRVTLRQSPEGIELEIRDDGIGFDANALKEPAPGLRFLGLLGMQERVLLAQGKMEIISAPGEGCSIRASFPPAQAVSELL